MNLRTKKTIERSYKHGHSKRGHLTPEVRAYYSARSRCLTPTNREYPYYGGRGIKFLFKNFSEFLAEVGMKPRPKKNYSLDRWPNNNGHYERGNVRWATTTEQANNRRSNQWKRALQKIVQDSLTKRQILKIAKEALCREPR